MEFVSLLVSLFRSPENQIIAILAISIPSVAFLLFLGWLLPKWLVLTSSLKRLSAKLQEGAVDWNALHMDGGKTLHKEWDWTSSRVVQLQCDDSKTWVMWGRPEDIWNARSLLARRVNLDLAETVPNILVGVGLFFTFLFLTLALTETTAVLTQTSSSEQTQAAISDLLRIAGAKFLTSLTALLASIIWTWWLRGIVHSIQTKCEGVLRALGQRVQYSGGELLIRMQLAQDEERAAKLNEGLADGMGLVEELLKETRESTGALKRFETDWAVSMGKVMGETVGSRMQEMTEKLTGAIENLSDRMGVMNQEALEKMMADFTGLLKQQTSEEIEQMRVALQGLTSNLQQAGTNFGTEASRATEALTGAGNALMEQVSLVASGLSETVTRLDSAGTSLKATMNDLDTSLRDMVAAGSRGAEVAVDAIGRGEKLLRQLEYVSDGLAEAAAVVGTAMQQVQDAVHGVSELTTQQQQVLGAVREVAPAAIAAVERVSTALDDSARHTLKAMLESRRSMDQTADTMKDMVNSITTGVTSYTDQVAGLHRSMDENLAKAVVSFDRGVNDLAETMGELPDTLPSVLSEALSGTLHDALSEALEKVLNKAVSEVDNHARRDA